MRWAWNTFSPIPISSKSSPTEVSTRIGWRSSNTTVAKRSCAFYPLPDMKRAFSVTILLWLVLILTAWSGLRLATAIQWWATLLEFASPPGPLYIAVSAGVWLVVGIGLVWGMWQAKAWIRYALIGTAASFTVWYWCDRLLFQSLHENWPFTLGATSLLLIIVMICLAHPSTKAFFKQRENHDR